MREHESSHVVRSEIAGHRQHAFALDLVAEDRNGQQIGAERHFVEREQRPGSNREVLSAGFTAPTRSAAGTAASIYNRTAAMWAVGLTLVVSPAEPNENAFDFLIAHPHDGR
jgi:hypothetical protein